MSIHDQLEKIDPHLAANYYPLVTGQTECEDCYDYDLCQDMMVGYSPIPILRDCFVERQFGIQLAKAEGVEDWEIQYGRKR